ncbi:MAG: IclR family transcriptional regulator [Acidobacteriota bacterium]
MASNPDIIASSRSSADPVEDPYRLQSLDRAVAILQLLGESEVPLSLAEICRLLNLHKSTAHRALIVLERGMLLERTPENTFRLGLKLFELGNRAVQQMDVRARIRPYARLLAAQLGETVHVGVLQNASVVYLDKAGPGGRVCSGSKTGTSNPAYCTSLGKAMLAWMPARAVHHLADQMTFVRFTEKTIGSREELLNALQRVRRRGYSVDDEEIEAGVRCIGAPILDEAGMPIAALSVSCVSSRIQPYQAPVLAGRIMRCCAEISESLRLQRKIRGQAIGDVAETAS